ncbi:hypothetical protein CLOM_g17681, partial [Closterium sp. NIES-68]
GRVQLAGFCMFEACVGVFWPSIMRMRAQYFARGVALHHHELLPRAS